MSEKKVIQIGGAPDEYPDWLVPNQWRVMSVADDKNKFHVFRNPPMAGFANDESGNRRSFTTYAAAQVVADSLNAKASS